MEIVSERNQERDQRHYRMKYGRLCSDMVDYNNLGNNKISSLLEQIDKIKRIIVTLIYFIVDTRHRNITLPVD